MARQNTVPQASRKLLEVNNIHAGLMPIIASLLAAGTAAADPALSLHADNGLIGSESQARISVTAEALTSTGGFNGSIMLPAGISVIGAGYGSAIDSGYFNLQYAQNASDFRFVVYSSSANSTVSGDILSLQIHIDSSLTPGVKQLVFSSNNPDPRVNSRHAISNVDGSQSLAHTTANTSFLIYTLTSDHDGDGMSDYYESRYGLDPFVNDANEDPDGDGYTNLEEYQRHSDPTDQNDYNDCLGDEIHIVTQTYSDNRPHICRANNLLIMDSGANIVISETAAVYFGAPEVIVASGATLSVKTGAIFKIY